MIREVILLHLAESDLETAFAYLDVNAGLEIALHFYESIFRSLDRLREMPLIGAKRENSDPSIGEIRMWPVKTFEEYLIFYKIFGDSIHIVRILHSSQDTENIILTEMEN